MTNSTKFEEKLLKSARPFLPFAEKISGRMRNLEVDLIQSRSSRSLVEHIAISLYQAVKNSILLCLTFVLLGIILDKAIFWQVGLASLPLVFAMTLYTGLYSPKVAVKKRARLIDQELPYALRHLLIEVKSGVTLYQSLVTVSDGYGACSEEIKTIVREINGGKSQSEAIEESIVRNPSLQYRRSFWHLLNALKTGTTIEQSLASTVEEIMREQMLSIKKYGQELNPWTLMYMMLGVILPSLGITFMMILSTFTGMPLSNGTLIGILFFLVAFQILFINIIRTKRPLVKT